MRRFTTRIIVVLLTFVVGIAAVTIWTVLRHSPANPHRLLSGQPCRDGLVSVEARPDAPIRVTVLETACRDTQSANTRFVVMNVSTKPISEYEIRSIETYERLTRNGSAGVSTNGFVLQPHQTQDGFLGGGVTRGVGAVPVGPLKSYKLAVWSVSYNDGTTWRRTSSGE